MLLRLSNQSEIEDKLICAPQISPLSVRKKLGPCFFSVFHREQSVSWAELIFSSTFNTGFCQLSSSYILLSVETQTNKWNLKHNFSADGSVFSFQCKPCILLLTLTLRDISTSSLQYPSPSLTPSASFCWSSTAGGWHLLVFNGPAVAQSWECWLASSPTLSSSWHF